MQGNRDSAVYHKDHSYIIWNVVRCSEETRQEGDPECATTPEIDKWVGTKRIFMRVLNEKVDFKSWDEESFRQNEIWFPMIPMNSGKFTD